MWILAAYASALFAGLVPVLGKVGVCTTDSDVATAVRTTVVLAFAWLVALTTGAVDDVVSISQRTWMFLVLSGIATGASWIFYFRALSVGDVSKVAPVDKSSAVLATLLAIVLFGETDNLALKLPAISAILAGTLMMIERSDASPSAVGGRSWLAYAVLSALFAALTSIFGKLGIDGVESNLGTAIRTCVVFAMAWAIVAGKGKLGQVRRISKREGLGLVLSGISTGASWLCYYYAIQVGVVSVVVQIDKLSVLVSVLIARIAFREKLTRRAAVGLALLVAGTLIMTAFA